MFKFHTGTDFANLRFSTEAYEISVCYGKLHHGEEWLQGSMQDGRSELVEVMVCTKASSTGKSDFLLDDPWIVSSTQLAQVIACLVATPEWERAEARINVFLYLEDGENQ